MNTTTEDAAWLDQFESVGVNCEAGFVLQQLGAVRPSLFRWTFIDAANLIKLLKQDFAGFFDRDNVVPHTDSMVMDTAFHCAFHSAMKSDSERKFLLDENRLKALFRIEKQKIDKEVSDFRARLREGQKICILKDPVVSDDTAREVLEAIDSVADNETNALLFLTLPRSAGEVAGEIVELEPRLMRGVLSRIAPIEQANDAQYDEWTAILTDAASRRAH